MFAVYSSVGDGARRVRLVCSKKSEGCADVFCCMIFVCFLRPLLQAGSGATFLFLLFNIYAHYTE